MRIEDGGLRMEDRTASGLGGDCSRREFIRTTTVVAAATAGGLVPNVAAAADVHGTLGAAGSGALIDTNVSLSRWPCRRLPLDETPGLVARLRSQGAALMGCCIKTSRR